MGKLAKLKNALDMSHAARMKRAAEQGFNTDKVWMHGTNQDIREFSHKYGGDVTSGHPASQNATWMADDPAHASQYAEMAGKHTRANKVQIENLRPEIERRVAAAEKRGDWDEWERLTEFWEELELGDATKGGENVLPLMARTRKTYIFDPQKSDLNLLEALEKAKSEGYDSFLWKGSTDTPYGNVRAGEHLAVFDPANIRSTNAAFDPANIGKNDLLGNADPTLLGGLAAGTAAAEFARRRAEKQNFWTQAKGAIEAGATVGSGLAGGILADLSRLGGYLNPFMPVERTERGAEAIQNAMTYQPSESANAFLEPIGIALGTFQQDIERGVDALNIEQSIPYKAYNALPERAKGIIRTGADYLF